jgi:hypothetical protein
MNAPSFKEWNERRCVLACITLDKPPGNPSIRKLFRGAACCGSIAKKNEDPSKSGTILMIP